MQVAPQAHSQVLRIISLYSIFELSFSYYFQPLILPIKLSSGELSNNFKYQIICELSLTFVNILTEIIIMFLIKKCWRYAWFTNQVLLNLNLPKECMFQTALDIPKTEQHSWPLCMPVKTTWSQSRSCTYPSPPGTLSCPFVIMAVPLCPQETAGLLSVVIN